MKKNYLVNSAIALGVVSLIGGSAMAVNAATRRNGVHDFGGFNQTKGQVTPRTPLTAAQIATMKANITAIQTALNNNDYNAWVTAMTVQNPNSPLLKTMTADNFSAYAAKYKTRAADMTAQQTKMTAIKTALDNGDYSGWVTAEKAVNANSPLLIKITADNFASYAQANKLQEQAATIMKTLGLDGPDMGQGGRGFMGGVR